MHIETLIKLLILLLSEYKVSGRLDSVALAKKVLEETTINKKAKVFNDDTELIVKLRELITSIIEEQITPNEELLLSIELMLTDKPMLTKVISKYVDRRDQNRVISNLLVELNAKVKQMGAKRLLQKALALVASNNTDTDTVLESLIDNLTDVKTMRDITNPAIVDKIDFSDENSIKDAADRAAQLVTGGDALQTGWACLNKMTQGGFRRGETVCVGALPHNYKSSFTKSVFMQIATLNKPVPDNVNKIPTLLLISLEEEVDNIMSFFYLYLKHTVNGITFNNKEQKNLDPVDMRNYVTEHLAKASGYHIEVLRFKPEMLTYSVLFNAVDMLEKQNYEIHGLFLDYAKKMNRAGCKSTGPMGTDLLDLFSRLRNRFSASNTLFFTPHQLSTGAKQLLRNGMPPLEFVKAIQGGGYYADSSQIDQELDLELFIHIVKVGSDSFLSIQRGKHRIPTVISTADKYALLEFADEYSPIRGDSENYKACKKEAKSDDEFDF